MEILCSISVFIVKNISENLIGIGRRRSKTAMIRRGEKGKEEKRLGLVV